MKKWLVVPLLLTASFSYANNFNFIDYNTPEKISVQKKSKSITTIPPVNNITINVFANSIQGPVKKLITNSCITAVDFIKPLVGNKPITIRDGGYIVDIQQNDKNYVLSSHQEILFSWIHSCEKNT